jgi:hypothetical protein
MSRTLILGAGFSKALAEAPLADELTGLIYEKAVKGELGDVIGWYDGQVEFLNIIDGLIKTIEHGFNLLERDGTKIKNRSGKELISSINIEHLCTLIDLNINRPFIPKGEGIDLQSCPIPFMQDMYVHRLEDARRFILHYLVQLLLPESLKPKTKLLKKFIQFLKPDDTIITFNYDIILEQFLWREGLWNPVDGYVVGRIEENSINNIENLKESKIQILKIHGSINWQPPGFFETSDIKILLGHPYTGAPFFHNMRLNKNLYRPVLRHLLESYLVVPTFMKEYSSQWEQKLIKHAFKKISESEEIISIGYSFPQADSFTNFLMTQIPNTCYVKIVDLTADELADRLSENYQINRLNIVNEQIGIEEWILNDFKDVKYKEYQKEQKEIQELINYTKKSKKIEIKRWSLDDFLENSIELWEELRIEKQEENIKSSLEIARDILGMEAPKDSPIFFINDDSDSHSIADAIMLTVINFWGSLSWDEMEEYINGKIKTEQESMNFRDIIIILYGICIGGGTPD